MFILLEERVCVQTDFIMVPLNASKNRAGMSRPQVPSGQMKYTLLVITPSLDRPPRTDSYASNFIGLQEKARIGHASSNSLSTTNS